jgi:hypothetical protein
MVEAGTVFSIPVALRNASRETWPAEGGARVRLAFHWKTPAGERVVWDGERTEIGEAVAAGGRLERTQRIEAPKTPGRYVLELEPVFERVGWFSEKDAGSVCKAEIEVVAPAPSP